MIEKIYAYSKKKKILKKYAFLSPLAATNPLIYQIISYDRMQHLIYRKWYFYY